MACYQVSASSLVMAEIMTVVTAMRRNTRWQSSLYVSVGSQGLASSMGLRNKPYRSRASANGRDRGEDLLGGFAALRSEMQEIDGTRPNWPSNALAGCDGCHSADIKYLDALTLLGPFLAVVRSPATSGPITALALSAVSKFLTYGLVHASSPSLHLALAQLSSAATHCKFEASDSVSDEMVLLKILHLLKDVLDAGLVSVLSDEAVCEMMETGLSMCCQMRLSGASLDRLCQVVTLQSERTACQRCCVGLLSAPCKLSFLQFSALFTTSTLL
jgi:golgi-specific brefeldin A-resistance guanine nucleotide exchange factor 1